MIVGGCWRHSTCDRILDHVSLPYVRIETTVTSYRWSLKSTPICDGEKMCQILSQLVTTIEIFWWMSRRWSPSAEMIDPRFLKVKTFSSFSPHSKLLGGPPATTLSWCAGQIRRRECPQRIGVILTCVSALCGFPLLFSKIREDHTHHTCGSSCEGRLLSFFFHDLGWSLGTG